MALFAGSSTLATSLVRPMNRHTEGIIICGIFGSVVIESGKQWNAGIVRALAWANRERGTDSLGFFDSSGKMTKGAGDPSDVIRKKRMQKWLKHSRETGWFVAGHTRFATRGKVNRRNSHPFRYGRIIGSHNGMCDAPRKFQVDSEYLFYSLNKARGDYQKGLEDISGYFGLSWYDGSDFYLLCHSGELAYEIIDGVLYYSSSWSHLDSCTGGNSNVLSEGQVIRISPDGTIADSTVSDSPIEKFTSKSYTTYGKSYYTRGYDDTAWSSTGRSGSSTKSYTKSYNSGGCSGTSLQELDSTGNVTDAAERHYDDEWCDAWAEYCTQSEHSVVGHDDNDRYAG